VWQGENKNTILKVEKKELFSNGINTAMCNAFNIY